jgi:hypothetical protein
MIVIRPKYKDSTLSSIDLKALKVVLEEPFVPHQIPQRNMLVSTGLNSLQERLKSGAESFNCSLTQSEGVINGRFVQALEYLLATRHYQRSPSSLGLVSHFF